MLLTDHALELLRKNTLCEQILGRVMHRIGELCPDFATMNCKRIHTIDAHDVVVTGIESQEDSTDEKFRITLSYPRKGQITIQFCVLNSISGVTTSHEILSFPLDSPCNEEELISRTDEVLKTTGAAREPRKCAVA